MYSCRHARCEYTASEQYVVVQHERAVIHRDSPDAPKARCSPHKRARDEDDGAGPSDGGARCGVQKGPNGEDWGHSAVGCQPAMLECEWGSCECVFATHMGRKKHRVPNTEKELCASASV